MAGQAISICSTETRTDPAAAERITAGEVTFSFIDRASKEIVRQPLEIQKHGQSGKGCFRAASAFREHLDDVTVIRSMHTDMQRS